MDDILEKVIGYELQYYLEDNNIFTFINRETHDEISIKQYSLMSNGVYEPHFKIVSHGKANELDLKKMGIIKEEEK